MTSRVQALLSGLLLIGCTGGHGRPVDYVLPDGYRGEFEIIQAKDGGRLPIENGAEVCQIPTNGLLKVDSLEAFRRWHTESARYASGGGLELKLTSDAPRVPDEVCVYRLGSSHSKTRFFVGTHSDMLAHIASPTAQTKAEEYWSGGALKYRPVTNNISR